MATRNIKNVVFDFGNVLIAWDVKSLYVKIFNGDEQKASWFLSNICTLEWNRQLDEGVTFDDAIAQLLGKWPEYEEEIKAYKTRWHETIVGEISPSVNVLKNLKNKGYPLYGLTNWSHETIGYAKNRFPFLNLLDGIVVSGEEKVSKPDNEIFEILLKRYQLNPNETLFIDDNGDNIKTADKLGFDTIWFQNSDQLETEIVTRNLFKKKF
ncbi:MAG: HAD family hydrolase [Alphaproteobacteria bacterium]